MKSVTSSTAKADRKIPAPRQQQPMPSKPSAQKLHVLPLSPCEDPQARIAKRAYELYCERGYRDGSALDDWLDAEREILSPIPSL
jgi:hypothetical protein